MSDAARLDTAERYDPQRGAMCSCGHWQIEHSGEFWSCVRAEAH